jgi:integrin beta 2
MDYLYWADSDHGTVTRIRRDGTGRQTVVEHFESMESIPVDWLPGEPEFFGCENVYMFTCEETSDTTCIQ